MDNFNFFTLEQVTFEKDSIYTLSLKGIKSAIISLASLVSMKKIQKNLLKKLAVVKKIKCFPSFF